MAADFDVIILGAGLGGLAMATRLKQAGIDRFAILEQGDGAGGTWRDNIYPGAACDTESHLYCFDFALHLGVSRMYARQPELLAYAERIVADQCLGPHIRYGHRITAAVWDAVQAVWRIEVDGRAPLTARAFIPAWGQLNRPRMPDIPGRGDFAGLAFHSARWPAALDLSGCRVASIGNAASAVQYIPEIAPLVAHLDIFQRSPNWIVPRLDRPYTADELASYQADPELFRANRTELFEWRETTFLRMREGSAEAREVEQIARDHLAAQVDDPAIRAKLTPDFPLGCKRVLRSDDYLPVLNRDNVALVTDPIERIAADGVVTAGGVLHRCDVIVYGTGFETQSFQGQIEVRGADGQSLRAAWSEGARLSRHDGAGLPQFLPDLWAQHQSRPQFGAVDDRRAGALHRPSDRAAARRPGAALDVRAEVAEAFDMGLQEEMSGSAWAGSCRSWYKNDAGRVVNNWSGPVADYLKLTAAFDPAAYRESATAPA